MPRISTHPALPWIASVFGTIFLGFGASYMLYPRATFRAFGFQANPSTTADLKLMDAVMVLYGARDLFMGAATIISIVYGSRTSTGLILVAASLCAAVDGWIVKGFAGEGEWNHWGYGSVMGFVGLVMAGLLG